jgi:hypothetical protein
MEFFLTILVVTAVSVWLGLRMYRLFRRAAGTPQRTTPDCATGCPECSEGGNGSSCSKLADVGRALAEKKSAGSGP